jgi:hypothetical protein
MTYFTKGLLTMLISLFILSACKNPTGIGLEVTPEDELKGDFVTLPVEARTVRDESSRSANFSQTVFGYFNDPALGTTIADLAMEIGVPSSYPYMFIDTQVDSAVLVLPYGIDYYGDTTSNSPIRLIVRQLDEPYAYGMQSNKQWAVKDEILGSVTIPRYAISDTVYVKRYINGKDTVVRDMPQIRIPLDGNFFKTLFSVDSNSIASFQAYRAHTKGLYLSVDTSVSGGIGGLVTLRAINSRSGVDLVYRQHNGLTGEAGKIETYRRFFPIYPNAQNSVFELGLASSVRTQYLPAVLEALEQPQRGEERVYLQGAAGLRAQIDLNGLDSLRSKNIAVSKAELILPIDAMAIGTQYSVSAPRLTLYREDIAGQRMPVPDGDTRVSNGGVQLDPRSLGFQGFGGYFDSVRKRYVFYLTSYVQDILLNNINNTTIYVAPAHPLDQFVPVNPVLNTGSRTILNGSKHPTQPMQLKVYYTEVK